MGNAAQQLSAAEVLADAEDLTAEELAGDPRLAAELDFQQCKQFRNRLLAYMDSALLESEVSLDLLPMAQAYHEHKAKLSKQRARDEKKKFALMSPMLPDLAGQSLFLQKAEWAQLPYVAGRDVVGDRLDAKVFVMEDPSSPGERNSWLLGMLGGHSIDLTFLRTAGAKGVCFAWEPAVAIQRKIYICQGFSSAHPELAHIVRFASRSPSSKWKLLDDWETFMRYRHNGMSCIALTTRVSMNVIRGRNVFCKETFFQFITAKVVSVSRNLCSK